MEMKDLRQLATLTELVFLKEAEQIRPLIAQEQGCRRRLAQLDKSASEADRHYAADPRLRASGAEIAWKSWEAGTRSRLNVELARVVALRRHATERVQRAFGRDQSMQALLQTTRQKALRDHARRQEAQLSEAALLRPPRRNAP